MGNLGVLHIDAALLTHPERLTGEHQLRIDCLGSTYSIDETPPFSFTSGQLEFCANCCGDASSFLGTAMGFVRPASASSNAGLAGEGR